MKLLLSLSIIFTCFSVISKPNTSPSLFKIWSMERVVLNPYPKDLTPFPTKIEISQLGEMKSKLTLKLPLQKKMKGYIFLLNKKTTVKSTQDYIAKGKTSGYQLLEVATITSKENMLKVEMTWSKKSKSGEWEHVNTGSYTFEVSKLGVLDFSTVMVGDFSTVKTT